MSEQVVTSARVGEGRIEVVVGDLTEQRVDAIVNAANSALAHGGGVAGAIVRKGGIDIQAESDVKAPVPVGGAAVTGAGRLPCRFVIHAVGPRWGEGEEEDKLRRAVHTALALAEELGLESVALPAISTGIFGYPKAEGCAVIVQETADRLCDPRSGLRVVRLVSIDRETADHFATALTLVRKKC
jgi:O-acetyl-ADP-ribose deacetylase (regulator of RNase III)